MSSPRRRPRRRTAQQAQPQLRRLLDNLTTIPGMVLGRSTDILAWNPLAAARTVVAHLRTRAAKYPDDPRLAVLVGELSMRSPEFRKWWGAHPVAARTMSTKALNHPVVGTLTLDWNLLASGTDAGQELVIWTAEPARLPTKVCRSSPPGTRPRRAVPPCDLLRVLRAGGVAPPRRVWFARTEAHACRFQHDFRLHVPHHQ
ncbi:MmyB family transcriptional regulator [Saccharothrix deserti]|uniref:MmyB family transcriptional regulator n=1 Tax=Saccharothrix deserti TaxID=2593674 RepID=UPI00192E6CA3